MVSTPKYQQIQVARNARVLAMERLALLHPVSFHHLYLEAVEQMGRCANMTRRRDQIELSESVTVTPVQVASRSPVPALSP